MPAVTAHYYFGQQVRARLPEELRALAAAYAPAYDLGLQGPDLLFFHEPIRQSPVAKRGGRIHEQPARELLAEAVRAVRERPSDEALAYLLGFACHFVLDSSLHGDIALLAPQTREHLLLEAEMDRQILRRHFTDRPQLFKRHTLVAQKLRDPAVLSLIYPDVTLRQLKKCVRSMVFYTRLLRCRFGIKKTLLAQAERAAGREGSFTGMMVCGCANRQFYGAARALCGRIPELEGEAASAAVSLYDCVRSGGTLHPVFDRNFG